MQKLAELKNTKITLDVSFITKWKKQFGLSQIKNINKYLKNLVQAEISESNELLVSIFDRNAKNEKNDNKIFITKSVTFSNFLIDFMNSTKQSGNSASNKDETEEVEEANSDDFDEDDE